MTDVIFPAEAMRILRDIQRKLADNIGRFDALTEELGLLRHQMHTGFGALNADIQTLREEVRRSLYRQDAILVNNSVLIDEQAERIAAIEVDHE
jgi:hypothetical protein